MALRAFRTVTSETSAFEAAKARWAEVSAERRALKDKLDGCRSALVLADHKPGRGEYMSSVVEDRARRFLDGRLPNRELLARQVVELEDALAQQAESYSVEAAAWRAAVEAESARRAEALRPRHRAACRRIAQLVEQLSLAVEAERAVRAELAEIGAGGALPDGSRELGSLAEYGSTLSAWNRRLLHEGAFG